jgi:hypothetical protein
MHARIAKSLEDIKTQRWARLLEAADSITSAVERLDHRFKSDHLVKLISRMRASVAREYVPEHLRDVAAAINAVAIDLEKFSNQLIAVLPRMCSRTAP